PYPPLPNTTRLPYTTLFRSHATGYYAFAGVIIDHGVSVMPAHSNIYFHLFSWGAGIARMPSISNRIRVSPGMPYLLGSGIQAAGDRKSKRLNSSHVSISYAL